MGKYRKKPVEIEAIKFDGSNAFEIWSFVGDEEALNCIELQRTDQPYIKTMEGVMLVSPGDWVIKGIEGEFYPCKPNIFAKTYDAVGE